MSVKVTGLRDLRRELRNLENEGYWKPRLRTAGLGAAEIVATEARRTALAGAVTISGVAAYMGSIAVSTIRALAGQTRATVAGGKGSLGHFGGWEFGSAGAYSQFPRKRKSGYNIYPAVKTKRESVLKFYTDALGEITREAFPD